MNGDESRTTLQSVAERAGVSIATVSYTFSAKQKVRERVSQATRDRVQAAADELNYRPNVTARAMRTGRTGAIQLALTMLSDPWSLALVEAVNRQAQPAGLTNLIMADGDWRRSLERSAWDAAFIDSIGSASPEDLRRLTSSGQRLIVFDDGELEPDTFDVVRSRPLPGCVLAVDHLLERFDDVGALASVQSIADAETRPTRYSVYRDRLRAHGIAVNPEHTEAYVNDSGSAFAAALRLLSKPRRPRAVYATTDFAAIALINAAHFLGLSVPGDMAVVGVGNTPDAQRLAPTLTTTGPVNIFDAIADLIVSRALDDEPSDPQLHDFSWQLIPGGSTGTADQKKDTEE